MIEKMLDMIGAHFPMTVCDTGDFATLKAKGMKFTVRAWKAEKLGHVSVMEASGFFGLMKMDTLIVNPTEVDLPLYSYDRILAAGNDTLIIELYDTLLGKINEGSLNEVKRKYAALPERDPGKHWYDNIRLGCSISKKGKKVSESFDKLTEEHFSAFLGLPAVPVTDPAAKREKTLQYVDGLLKNGGPSTDVFKKQFGEAFTSELFRKVLFGCE